MVQRIFRKLSDARDLACYSPSPTFQNFNLKTIFHDNLQCLKVVTQVSNKPPENFVNHHKLWCEKLFLFLKTWTWVWGGGEEGGGLCDLVSKPLKSFHFPEISVTIWNANFWRHVWHNAVTIYKKTFFFILNTKTFSALFFQLVKTCCNKLLIQETLMLLFYIYKESQSSLSNRVWKAKCKYIIFYRGTCRQVDKKTFFISAIYRSKRPGVFCKKDVLKNFAEFTGKHLCRNHFLKKLQAWPATLLKKWLWHKWFFVNFENFSRTRFLWNISGDCLGIIQNKPQNEQIFINVWHSQKGHMYLNKRVNNNEKLKS